MQMTEESLSDKITIGRFAPTNQSQFKYYKEEDVKEFIKRLKEEIEDSGVFGKYGLLSLIDKLAGEKLT